MRVISLLISGFIGVWACSLLFAICSRTKRGIPPAPDKVFYGFAILTILGIILLFVTEILMKYGKKERR